MDWLIKLFTTDDSVAHIVLLYSLVISLGVYLGKIKVGGISLGVTFILFVGILAGHIGFTGPTGTLNFLQDFGLILFVFMIGLQVGPGFFESFGKGGLRLNLLACLAILLNVLVMFSCYFAFFDTTDHKNLPMMVGTMYGAVTNTPGLGAAKEALYSVFPNGMNFDIASGYACAYPLGVIGIIGATLAIRFICKVDIDKENALLTEAEGDNPNAKPHTMYLRVENSYIGGRTLQEITDFLNRDVVCTRLMHNGELSIPSTDTVFHVNDEILIVCAEADAEAVAAFIGPQIDVDWHEEEQPQQMVSRRIVVTNSGMNGKVLSKLHFRSVYGVNVTRISRQGMDLFASNNYRFQVGDRIMVVGFEENVQRVAELMGNSERRLNAPNIATIFVGVVVGILFGSLPLAIPGMPVPLKLGLAGGPLIIAILLGRFGHRMKLVTYTTTSANMMLREIGLALFLASVGIKAGAGFWDTVVQGDGLKYVYTGFLITIIPILIVGTIARLKYKLNYFTVMGAIAGAYTDPPALAYANSVCSVEAPALGYSTVYPLSMFLRILVAQLIILFCCGA
ncbi:putative transporter [Prevotella pallens]|jgi:aspT/yidE/ybjL antiporter duplication domain|uniref:Putative transporter n=1 Tax=Prevotella pallens TaxID=60133 RepID=A0A379EZH0_9BACT|nr:putative transporter [Prevotella pallens]MBF1442343.1 putative transporter [Prevotella pallens]MBF1450544.1 putative transporter [Prevotella pallens]MBF1460169.1 putative transporter [Prevotella pallens]MBF1463766.1 putative transporter [Prevotella pallens]MBF1472102.1 putative transporter [Prevotella pallens]